MTITYTNLIFILKEKQEINVEMGQDRPDLAHLENMCAYIRACIYAHMCMDLLQLKVKYVEVLPYKDTDCTMETMSHVDVS
jgi:hypothetical protein